jgi:dCMP deaminase
MSTLITALELAIVQQKTRTSWDEYFMSIAVISSSRSSCSKLNVGSVIVKSNRIISMGYNGHIAGAPHSTHERDGHEMSTIHSEVNAIGDCAKRGVSLEGGTIYITHYPCINCFKSIASCGIKEICYLHDYKNDELVVILASESKIQIRKF